ncbi:protein kinase domain protein [Ichthyophthirius multifiliis]|uniref:Protein kinase domain protein n=1 Tax=Ichthyophthirius multifiliis TaxID=5932 RepID=G0QMK1_ICHMU|nr:protein kinase domain protein [Ichthyophthirius multifiliis]EGR33567.1 protein kinase domain protein [Ichthyophthirius multifiliis]|eukprot:XP_004037553.1 protein kinase domain protein [Ichthyophthirius multifiliis]
MLEQEVQVKIKQRFKNIKQKKGLSEELYDEDYQNITSIDISQTVVKNMNEKYKDKGSNFKYLQMDVRELQFSAKQFDFVIDKGTLDCILCGECSTANSYKALQEIYRVLTNKGIYFLISYGSPENRKNILQRPEFQWDIIEQQIAKPKVSIDDGQEKYHYIYICKKNVEEENTELN